MNTNHRKKLTFICSFLLIVLLFIPNIQAQNKNDLDKKIKNIKGNVEKISIKTDKGTVDFTGKVAKELLERLKKKELKYIFTSTDEDFIDGGENIFFVSDDDVFNVDLLAKDGIKKTIKVKDVNGKKEITIKTTKDGKTTVKTLKGKEAQEYLDKHKVDSKHFSWEDKNGKKIRVKIKKLNGKGWVTKKGGNTFFFKNKMKKHFIKDGDVDDVDIEKQIDVKVKNGVKEITVTTTKDGKETVKIYKGKEADKFLKKLKDDDHTDIDDEDGINRIIIIEKDKTTKKDKK